VQYSDVNVAMTSKLLSTHSTSIMARTKKQTRLGAFQKGNTYHKQSDKSNDAVTTATINAGTSTTSTRQRPKRDVFDAGVRESSAELPGRLRPSNQNFLDDQVGARDSLQQKEEHSEYSILKLDNVATLVTDFNNIHQKRSPNCLSNCSLIKHHHFGLCIALYAKCKHCQVSSSILMYDTLARQSSHGLSAGSLNTAAALACLKTKVGATDFRYCLAALDIQPPSRQLLQRKINMASDIMEEINIQSMKRNQQFVREVNIARGETPQNVDIEVDIGYNNRPRAGCETGTQAFAPGHRKYNKPPSRRGVFNCLKTL
jgi:hypothetical protein